VASANGSAHAHGEAGWAGSNYPLDIPDVEPTFSAPSFVFQLSDFQPQGGRIVLAALHSSPATYDAQQLDMQCRRQRIRLHSPRARACCLALAARVQLTSRSPARPTGVWDYLITTTPTEPAEKTSITPSPQPGHDDQDHVLLRCPEYQQGHNSVCPPASPIASNTYDQGTESATVLDDVPSRFRHLTYESMGRIRSACIGECPQTRDTLTTRMGSSPYISQHVLNYATRSRRRPSY